VISTASVYTSDLINPTSKAPRRRNGVRHTPWVGRRELEKREGLASLRPVRGLCCESTATYGPNAGAGLCPRFVEPGCCYLDRWLIAFGKATVRRVVLFMERVTHHGLAYQHVSSMCAVPSPRVEARESKAQRVEVVVEARGGVGGDDEDVAVRLRFVTSRS
jgi:hypothetical protein